MRLAKSDRSSGFAPIGRVALTAMITLALVGAMTPVRAEAPIDFSKPLFVGAGRTMCGSSSDVRAALAGSPSDCSQPAHAVPVIPLSDTGIGGIYQVRLLGVAAGTVVWVPYTSLTNTPPEH